MKVNDTALEISRDGGCNLTLGLKGSEVLIISLIKYSLFSTSSDLSLLVLRIHTTKLRYKSLCRPLTGQKM